MLPKRLERSEEILEECCEVLQRGKFKLDADDVVQSLSAFRAAVVLLNPRMQIVAARDRDDDKILECAIAAKADYMVTGNIRDFAKQFRGVSVLPPSRFPERPSVSHQLSHPFRLLFAAA